MALHSHSQDKNSWQIQEAKTYFSKLIHNAEAYGMQKITRQGHEVAVVISMREYAKLIEPNTSFIEFMTNSPLSKIDLPLERSKEPMREVDL